MKKLSTRPKQPTLKGLKNTSKGDVHHLTIKPAGGKRFKTTARRTRPAGDSSSMSKGGPYVPPPAPEDQEHDDADAMLAHVGKTFGATPTATDPSETGDDDGTIDE